MVWSGENHTVLLYFQELKIIFLQSHQMLAAMRINLNCENIRKYVTDHGDCRLRSVLQCRGNNSSCCNNDIIDAESIDDDRRMTTNFAKFRLLMWKNYLIQYRHPIQTVLEIIIPILFSIFLIGIRSIVLPEVVSNNTFYQLFAINTLRPLRWVNFAICVYHSKKSR